MISKDVGRIRNLKYNTESGNLEITIEITDNKFKKKLIRDLDLSGKIKFEKVRIILIEEQEDAEL